MRGTVRTLTRTRYQVSGRHNKRLHQSAAARRMSQLEAFGSGHRR